MGREGITRLTRKYQLTVPKTCREALGLKPGMDIAFLRVGDTLRLIPVRPLQHYRGRYAGVDTSDYRDETDKC